MVIISNGDCDTYTSQLPSCQLHYLCAGVSLVAIAILSNRPFHLFQHLKWLLQHEASVLQLAINDDGITFDNASDGLGNSLSLGGSFLSKRG